MGKRVDDAEWKMELRLRRFLKKLFYRLTILLIKVSAVVFVLYLIWYLISYFGGKDFVLFIIDVTADTGKFLLTRLQNNTVAN